MPSAGFEPVIPAIKRLQTYTLDLTTIGISDSSRCAGRFSAVLCHL